jgi:carboxymethylenebutenolidase
MSESTASRPVPGAVAASAVVSIEVELPHPTGDSLRGFLARPRTDAPRPGLLVIHEAMGLNEHIRDLARRFAAAGYDALAPDLYTRTGPPEPDDITSIFAKMLGLADRGVVADLDSAAAYLRMLDTATGKVGCIGFCSGGRQTLLFASSSASPDCAVDCWGSFLTRASPDDVVTPNRPTPLIDLVENVRCPLLLVGGVDDPNPSPDELAAVAERARRGGAEVTLSLYEGAGHAFLADYRPSYREEPAHQLWDEALGFLATHLVGQP